MRPVLNRPLVIGGQRFFTRSGGVETLETRSMPIVGRTERRRPAGFVLIWTLSVLLIGIGLGWAMSVG